MSAGTEVDENEEGKEDQYWLGNLVMALQLVQGAALLGAAFTGSRCPKHSSEVLTGNCWKRITHSQVPSEG